MIPEDPGGSEDLGRPARSQVPSRHDLTGRDTLAGRPPEDREADGARYRPRRRAAIWVRHPFWTVMAALAALAIVVVVAGFVWVDSQASPSGPPGPQVIVAVPSGTGTGQFAQLLVDHRVIGSALAFRIWIDIHGNPGVDAGSYAFDRNESFGAVKQVLDGGPNVYDLQVPPGFTVAEIATRLGQFPGEDPVAFQRLATSGSVKSPWQPPGVTNLDGLLGTGTYQVLPGETATQLLTQMVDRFNSQAVAMNLAHGAAALGLTPYQAITMASIVEKEGVIQKNLGPVARVILNRLSQNMPLQMDSTVLYAEGRDGGTVTSKDLHLQTPYNTYLNKGLTPTPICFPSPAALTATLNPPAGSWLFFVVVQPDGTEAFATTFAQQLANEALASRRGLP